MAPDHNLDRSDGHPVLILPGFAADDWSTVPLRWTVSSQGYWAHGWRLGRNVGPTARVVAGLRDRVEQLGRAHGRRVSVVGWSLGGVYARALARERPELVRQVISLGSPFRSFEPSPAPLAVPATSIYTRTDGVTSWQNCIDWTGPRAENIEVFGTHTGLGVNPAVILAVLDRLGQPEDDWQPFRPPWWARCSYPEPETTKPSLMSEERVHHRSRPAPTNAGSRAVQRRRRARCLLTVSTAPPRVGVRRGSS